VHFLVIETLALRCYGDPVSPPNAVQRWLVANLSEPWLLLGFAGLCLLASWVIGWLSWHLFEQRLLRWKRHFPSVSDRPAP
jgi:peptidoglycan/LPS O-acetylase OafA/YrhL